jgi:hypothetical protein
LGLIVQWLHSTQLLVSQPWPALWNWKSSRQDLSVPSESQRNKFCCFFSTVVQLITPVITPIASALRYSLVPVQVGKHCQLPTCRYNTKASVVDVRNVSMGHWWNVADGRKPKYARKKKCPNVILPPQIPDGLAADEIRVSSTRSTNNRLSHGTVSRSFSLHPSHCIY